MKNQPAPKPWYSYNSEKFAILPIVAASDKRLSSSDLRVLITLASYANPEGLCWPRRKVIGEITGITTTNISRATSRLVEYGWLSKKQTGETSTYAIRAPAELTHDLNKRSPKIIQMPAGDE